MSTISANPFALLGGGDSDDEGGAVTSIPLKSAKPTPVSIAPQSKRTIPGQQARRERGDYPSRGAPRKVYGGQTAAGADTEVIGSKGAGLTDNGRDDRAERRGAAPRGRGRGRGTRGRGAARLDERLDRRSATGLHDSDRKVAAGWGAEEGKQELEAETEGYGDAKAALTPAVDGNDGWGTSPAGDSTAPVANGHASKEHAADEGAKEEEEDKTKTFEEYLAEKASAISNLPGAKKAARKPNEGADDSQWKGAVKLVKGQDEEEVFFQVNKEKKSSQAASKKSKEKTYIDVEPLGYRPPPRTGGDRGRGRGGRGRGDLPVGERREFNDNRGSGRGGRGRGGRGGYNGGARDLNTEDANAFPSLS